MLVPLPLGWVARTNMIKNANPQEKGEIPYIPGKQTIEFRAPDRSADLHHLMAGLIIAAQKGLQDENSLERANNLYVDVNIFDETNKAVLAKLDHLPQSCWDSAECLRKKRSIFEENNIFPKGTISRIINRLKAFEDKDLSEKLYGKNELIAKLVNDYIHCS